MFLENQALLHSENVATDLACDFQFRPDHPTNYVQTEPASLTALEQSVVAISLFDHPASIDPPCRFVRFLGWICGTSPPNQLANDRLEALRRYLILVRGERGAPGSEEYAKVRAVGFSDSALKEASALVALGRRR